MEPKPLNPFAEWIRRSVVEGVQAGLADLAGAANGVAHNAHAIIEPPPEPKALPPRRKPGRKPGPRKRLEPPAPPPDMDGPPMPRGEKTKQQRRAVAQFLSKRGRTPMMEIARECGIPGGSITSVLAYHWFDKSPEGVKLTELGREEFFDDDKGD